MIQRREFIAGLGGAAAWPLAARAQRPAIPVIGYLGVRSAATDASYVEAFRQGLSENGFIAGRNVQIEFHWANNPANQRATLPGLVAELVRRRVNLIVCAGGDAAPLAAKAATGTIPIVFSTGGDPVKNGLVTSLNRPGGNLTGVTNLTRELSAKRLGLLVDVVPKVTAIAYLVSSDALSPGLLTALATPNVSQTADLQEAARTIGRELFVLNVRSERDIEGLFSTMMQYGIGAFLVSGGFSGLSPGLLTALATRHGLPERRPGHSKSRQSLPPFIAKQRSKRPSRPLGASREAALSSCRMHSCSRIARRSSRRRPETTYRRSIRNLPLPEPAVCSLDDALIRGVDELAGRLLAAAMMAPAFKTGLRC